MPVGMCLYWWGVVLILEELWIDSLCIWISSEPPAHGIWVVIRPGDSKS